MIILRQFLGCLLLLMVFPLFGGEKKILSINLFSDKNGCGLETDRNLLKTLLEKQGYSVACLAYLEPVEVPHYADINLFIEKLNPDRFPWAPRNWFIPNPEWYRQDLKLLDQVDLILCRTREVERIFKDLKKACHFLGFSSPDRYNRAIPKDYFSLVHLPGGSVNKGTETIAGIWKNNRSLPLLKVVRFDLPIASQHHLMVIPSRLPISEFENLQNSSGIHLCPSETEGFGHYIMEAMSTGAVVITTDPPPMNEFITDRRCLAAWRWYGAQNLATNYYVDPASLENTILNILSLPESQLEAIGQNNRRVYLQKREEFERRLRELFATVYKDL